MCCLLLIVVVCTHRPHCLPSLLHCLIDALRGCRHSTNRLAYSPLLHTTAVADLIIVTDTFLFRRMGRGRGGEERGGEGEGREWQRMDEREYKLNITEY